MKFSALNPRLGSAGDLSSAAAPVWELNFKCSRCGCDTGIRVSGRPAQHPVWHLTPDPMALLNSIQSPKSCGELIEVQWARIWDGVTIEPSMQNLPHPRQVTCNAHITVTRGDITNH